MAWRPQRPEGRSGSAPTRSRRLDADGDTRRRSSHGVLPGPASPATRARPGRREAVALRARPPRRLDFGDELADYPPQVGTATADMPFQSGRPVILPSLTPTPPANSSSSTGQLLTRRDIERLFGVGKVRAAALMQTFGPSSSATQTDPCCGRSSCSCSGNTAPGRRSARRSRPLHAAAYIRTHSGSVSRRQLGSPGEPRRGRAGAKEQGVLDLLRHSYRSASGWSPTFF